MVWVDVFLFTFSSFKMWLFQEQRSKKEISRLYWTTTWYIGMDWWYSLYIGHFKGRSALHHRLMLILPWRGKLVASGPAGLFPILAISIWLIWYLLASFARQDHWVTCGILNILLGLYHNQEWLLLLAKPVRNPLEVNTAQREGSFGVPLSQS